MGRLNREEKKERIENKCYAKLSQLMMDRELELIQEPYMALTQEMIDAQIAFIDREIEVWTEIRRLNELDR